MNVFLTARHAHGHRASGSRRHHHHGHGHGHGSEHKHQNAPTSPDPFAIGKIRLDHVVLSSVRSMMSCLMKAFAQAQHELADAPLLTAPPSTVAKNEGHDGLMPYDVRLSRFDSATRRTNGIGDMNVAVVDVDKLLEETAVATGAARALAERVEVLERALHVRSTVVDGQGQGQIPQVQEQGQGQSQVQRLDVGRRGGVDADGDERGGRDEYAAEGHHDGHSNGDVDPGRSGGKEDVEDGLRLRLRLAEAERDEAQRKLRDVRAYLLDEERS